MSITLKTLPEATAQQVFDQVATHLLKQNAKSQRVDGDGDPYCTYRGDGNTMCAAGCLMSDEEYLLSMESKNWCGLGRHGIVPETHNDLIASLQNIHDNYEVESWSQRLRDLAQSRLLNAEVLNAN